MLDPLACPVTISLCNGAAVLLGLTTVNPELIEGAVEMLLRGSSPSVLKTVAGLCGSSGSCSCSSRLNLLYGVLWGCFGYVSSVSRLPYCLCNVSRIVRYSWSSLSLIELWGDPPLLVQDFHLSL